MTRAKLNSTNSVRTTPQVRVAVYTRQSVASDLEFGSIEAQREAVEAYVASQRSKGWFALPTEYDDHGFSGSNVDRPAIQRLIADVEAGRVDVVAAYRFDRVSRSLVDFTRLTALLDQHGVGFVSITESFDTETPMGRFAMNMLATFGQFERETIAARTRDKMRATRRRGMWTGGKPPLGFDVVDKALKVNEDEAEVVRLLFGLYLDHGGLVSTVAELGRRGVRNKSWTTQSGKTVRGSAFNKSTLRKLLTNPLYVGKIRCGDELVDGRHEAIIDDELFAEVARALRENRRATRGPGKSGALLGGITRCARCGSALTHVATRRGNRLYKYYACVRMQKQGAAACPGSRAPAAELEEVVLERIKCIGTDPEVLLATVHAAHEARVAQRPELVAESRRLVNEKAQLASERKNLLDALQHGGGGANAIAGRLAEVDERIGRLDARHAEVAAELAAMETETVDEDELREALKEFSGVWDALVPKERARVLRLLVEEVRYDGQEGELELVFRDVGIRALSREAAARRTA